MNDLTLLAITILGMFAAMAGGLFLLWLVERPRKASLTGSLWGSECPRKEGPDA